MAGSGGLVAAFWTEAHNSPGATATGTRWALAEGEVGGPDGAETYVLIANTTSTAGTGARHAVLRGRHARATDDAARAQQPHHRRRPGDVPRRERIDASARSSRASARPRADRRRTRDVHQSRRRDLGRRHQRARHAAPVGAGERNAERKRRRRYEASFASVRLALLRSPALLLRREMLRYCATDPA